MHLHPDNLLLVVQHSATGYDRHSAVHRAEAEAAERARRREVWERRGFFLRYRLRSLISRLVPGLAGRLTI